MRKVFSYIIIFFCFFFFTTSVEALESDKLTLYLFHGDGCPHCASEQEFLENIEKDYANLEVVEYEVWYNEENSSFMNEIKEALDINTNGVPLTIIGESVIVGYSDATSEKIKRAIEYYSNNEYTDVVEKIKNGTFTDETVVDDFGKEEERTDKNFLIKLPLFGKVNLKKVSISLAAVLIGLIDGFNPCAMWILLFLISVLIGMKDRRKMWVLGLTFLVSSALVYMVIMMSWLNIVIHITTSILIRNIIACIALVGGVVNLCNYFKDKGSGCSVVDDKKRKRIFAKIKKFTHEKTFALAIVGIIGLAISVNIVELACSAGLPMIFMQLLALNNITGMAAFLYVLVYIFFFLLDDLVIFVIAMITMKVTGISTKYNKYSHLIGGILMLVVGSLLILKPEWLMFQFK